MGSFSTWEIGDNNLINISSFFHFKTSGKRKSLVEEVGNSGSKIPHNWLSFKIGREWISPHLGSESVWWRDECYVQKSRNPDWALWTIWHKRRVSTLESSTLIHKNSEILVPSLFTIGKGKKKENFLVVFLLLLTHVKLSEKIKRKYFPSRKSPEWDALKSDFYLNKWRLEFSRLERMREGKNTFFTFFVHFWPLGTSRKHGNLVWTQNLGKCAKKEKRILCERFLSEKIHGPKLEKAPRPNFRKLIRTSIFSAPFLAWINHICPFESSDMFDPSCRKKRENMTILVCSLQVSGV